jgi:hypothetical protein
MAGAFSSPVGEHLTITCLVEETRDLVRVLGPHDNVDLWNSPQQRLPLLLCDAAGNDNLDVVEVLPLALRLPP